MVWQDLLPRVPGIDLARVAVLGDHVVVHAATAAPVATCPRCGTPSHRAHSRYLRTLTDKPLGGRGLRVLGTARRFVCSHGPCPRATCAGAAGDLAPPRARTTADLADAHTTSGLAAGGEPGARLARDLDMPTSPDTIPRRVKAKSLGPGPPPRYVGIDDWAARKGRHYGTAVIDLPRARAIALLPGRDGEALAGWLRANPQVEVITRDRWPAYAKAAADAAPLAAQVAEPVERRPHPRLVVEEVGVGEAQLRPRRRPRGGLAVVEELFGEAAVRAGGHAAVSGPQDTPPPRSPASPTSPRAPRRRPA